MAQVTLTVPDGVKDRVFDAVAATKGYNAAQHGTKAQFTKSIITNFLKDIVKSYEGSEAGRIAQQNACNAVDTDINIT